MEASNDERAAPVDGGGALEDDPLDEAVDWLAQYAPEAAVASKKLDDGKRSPAGKKSRAAASSSAPTEKAKKGKAGVKAAVPAAHPPKAAAEALAVRTDAPVGRALVHRHTVVIPQTCFHLQLLAPLESLTSLRHIGSGLMMSLISGACDGRQASTHMVQLTFRSLDGAGDGARRWSASARVRLPDQVTPSRSLQQTAKLRSPDVHQALHEHRRPVAVVGFT